MLSIKLGDADVPPLAVPVAAGKSGGVPRLLATAMALEPALEEQLRTYLVESEHRGGAGEVALLPRPGATPNPVHLFGVGAGDEASWRVAGAAVVRAAGARHDALAVALPASPVAVAAFAEGAWLASYRFDLAEEAHRRASRLAQLILVVGHARVGKALERSRTVAEAVFQARDLTNTPSDLKSPDWFAEQVAVLAPARRGLRVHIRHGGDLLDEGFGGITAVGGGSSRPPALVEISWQPAGATRHVVLVGKGITFDSGGISVKSRDSMRLMRKDMSGAAVVCAATIAAARLGLKVRVTGLAALAENMISGSSYRPGDVVHHYGGLTTEVHNTDAEGRIVLGDALAYASHKPDVDYIVDLATLTGASSIALGKRIAAIFTEDTMLAEALTAAGEAVGEQLWRMPLVEEYDRTIRSDIADLNNSPGPGSGGGAISAALYLREFTGAARNRWAHVDFSAPAWSDANDGVLVKGATGWGVRMLLRWLSTLTP